MFLSCCGINHNTCTLSEREPFQLQKDELAKATSDFKEITGAPEAVVLATCNRIEFYRIDREKVDAKEGVTSFYESRGITGNKKNLDKLLFVRQGTSAARHQFKVAPGHDSVLLGEYQILGQVKSSYSEACSVDGPGKGLHKLFHNAFQISKRIRSETEIGIGAQGLAGAAVDILKDLLGIKISGLSAAVIGVNRSTDMLVRRLNRESVNITILNRTVHKAEKLARTVGALTDSIENISEVIANSDLLFSATSANDFVVLKDNLTIPRDNRQLVAVDLAVPRDIEPQVAEASGVTVLDLDDLKRYLDDVQQDRAVEMPYALDLIEEQVDVFEQWRRKSSDFGASELRKRLDDDRIEVLGQFRNSFRQGDSKALEALSRSLYRQFLRRVNSMNTPSSPE